MKNCLYFLLFIPVILNSCTEKKRQGNIITVTIEPQRYFAEQLAGPEFEIVAMVPPGVSPETYDPSPVQMAKLSDSDAYFRIGHIGFEINWIEKIHRNNPKLKVYDNSKGVSLITVEETETIQHGDHEHVHTHSGTDPHIWSSPKQARIIVRNMYEALVEMDELNEEMYTENFRRLEKKIMSTDSIVRSYLEKSKTKAFIIFHPALSYFARDYGLIQYAIEVDGKEPSPEQLKNLIEVSRIKEIKTVFVQQEFDRKNAEIIARETGCELVVINPLSYEWEKELINIAKILARE